MRYAVLYDFAVAYKLLLSLLLLAVSFYLRQWLDFLTILAVTAMVLMAEMFNTAIETLCDFVEEQHNEKIAVIKDIAAAATGVAIFAWAAVLLFEVARLSR